MSVAAIDQRPDLAAIASRITPDSRVLDIGCGDGVLMMALRKDRAPVDPLGKLPPA